MAEDAEAGSAVAEGAAAGGAAADGAAVDGVAAADVVPAGPLTLEDQVCFALSVADRRVVAVYRPLLEPLGLTHPQYLAMVALWQHAPVTLKRLGELLALDSGTLSPLLKRLEAAGLIRRRRDSADERNLVVEVTEQGLALRGRAADVHQGVVARLGLDRDDLEALRRVLTRVIDAAAGDPGPSR